MYQTIRQADAEAIVRILHENRSRESGDGDCSLCGCFDDHDESCPFGMADAFIAKYGTHPPNEPKTEVRSLVYPTAEEAAH